MKHESLNPWKTTAVKPIYDNPWISLEEHEVINPSGNPGIYGVVHYKNIAIGIIPVDENGYTWLVGQHRYPLKEYSWEIIEGGGLLGVDPLESAKRELKEETGMTAENWELILPKMHLSNSVSDEYAMIYIAKGLTEGIAEPTETEDLTLKHIPLQEALQMVLDEKITDSLSVAGLLMADQLGKTGAI